MSNVLPPKTAEWCRKHLVHGKKWPKIFKVLEDGQFEFAKYQPSEGQPEEKRQC